MAELSKAGRLTGARIVGNVALVGFSEREGFRGQKLPLRLEFDSEPLRGADGSEGDEKKRVAATATLYVLPCWMSKGLAEVVFLIEFGIGSSAIWMGKLDAPCHFLTAQMNFFLPTFGFEVSDKQQVEKGHSGRYCRCDF